MRVDGIRRVTQCGGGRASARVPVAFHARKRVYATRPERDHLGHVSTFPRRPVQVRKVELDRESGENLV